MSGLGSPTSMGGAPREFPSTAWSQLVEAKEDPEARRRVLENLARDYWKPVYAFIRFKWAKSNEDAKDLTQDFFIWLMEGDLVRRADPSRGRFRAFLKVALKNYVVSIDRKEHRQKRGGGRLKFALDVDWDEGGGIPNAEARRPEDILDDAWKAAVLERVMASLQETYERDGKGVYYRVFRDYYGGDEDVAYTALAQRHGISVSDVGNYLRHVKLAFRETAERMLAQTVHGLDELREEMQFLLGEAE